MKFYGRNPSKFGLDIQMLKSDMWLTAAVWIMQAVIRKQIYRIELKEPRLKSRKNLYGMFGFWTSGFNYGCLCLTHVDVVELTVFICLPVITLADSKIVGNET